MTRSHVFCSIYLAGIMLAGINSFADEIHSAAASGDTDKVTTLLASKTSNINKADANGKTPLHIAIENKDAKMAALLISRGANPIVKDASGKTPLRIAVASNSLECVNILVSRTTAGYIDPMLDSRLQDGVECLKDGTLAKASEMLGKLVRNDPKNESLNFAYGLSWLSLGDPAPAGAAFERALQINPENYRARTELARSRLAAKRYVEAKKELEKVLSTELPPDVKQSVTACLNEVMDRMTKWNYSWNIELAGIYDNNINVGPDSEIINISPVDLVGARITELRLSDSSKPKDSTGISLTASGRSSYDIGAPDEWLLTCDGAGYRNWLEEDKYEIGSIQAGAGAKLLMERGVFQAPLLARYIEYGGKSLTWIYGTYPSLIYAPKTMDNIIFTTTSSIEVRDYYNLTDRNGIYVSCGEILRRTFERGKYGIYCGADIQHDYADKSEYEYTGISLTAGSDARLPWKLNIFGQAQYSYKNYQGRNALAPKDQTVNQYQYSAGITRNISTRFSVNLTHNIIDNTSSFDLYEYKRQITTLGTNIRF